MWLSVIRYHYLLPPVKCLPYKTSEHRQELVSVQSLVRSRLRDTTPRHTSHTGTSSSSTMMFKRAVFVVLLATITIASSASVQLSKIKVRFLTYPKETTL